ncbi:choloylglycine hydrolase [Proteus hauseri ATCC 700826]|uniref:Choloylglycine hydrolase n=1 Tax=Proteus hauseri ATCC 700826 TaxID=1354271 RepID=A0AAJ3HQX8_PROHU|nr:linear amide C-N hydrolase [Proteus hauseri]OAT45686.1 choloylglycine hydrolase [Proteus hauseri ATCC 700826]
MMKKLRHTFLSTLIISSFFLSSAQQADACTRVVYLGDNNQIITARSMDWKYEIGTNLWIFPQGMERSGEVGDNSVKWVSKYGSVIASGFDISTTDGMNEKGLVANLLWLAESEYPTYSKNKPAISISAWAQYVLDNFATVEEAVNTLKDEPFIVVTDNLPDQNRMATLHLSLSDASGDSAIIEYIDGKQVIHHSREYQVMTNSPIFSEQLALNSYWQQIGGTVMLPGTNRASDRFARASFYVNAIPKAQSSQKSLASVFGVIRNVSVPYGLSTVESPEISSTRWRTVADHKNQLYFFESALSPNTFWVDLKKIDFSKESGKVMMLPLGEEQSVIYSANATDKFQPAKPFEFKGLDNIPLND